MDWAKDRLKGPTPEEERDKERAYLREVDRAEDFDIKLGEIEDQLNTELDREEFYESERLQELARLLRELVQVQQELDRARRVR